MYPEDCDRRISDLEELANKLRVRMDVIDGNGNPMAEGGFIGRMARQHKANQKLLWAILSGIATANLALWLNWLQKVTR